MKLFIAITNGVNKGTFVNREHISKICIVCAEDWDCVKNGEEKKFIAIAYFNSVPSVNLLSCDTYEECNEKLKKILAKPDRITNVGF